MNDLTAPIPPHVPRHLVRDFDYTRVPGDEHDVHLAWKRALEDAPDVIWTPHHGGHWVATRAQPIDDFLADQVHFSNRNPTVPPMTGLKLAPTEYDPPELVPMRNIFMPALAPGKIVALEGRVRQITHLLIDEFHARGECEFVGDFANKLPVMMFMSMVNLPDEDRDQLLVWTEWALRGTPDQRQQANLALAGYVMKWAEVRRANPGDDLISRVVTGTFMGRPLNQDETIGMLLNLLYGGLDTVAAMLGFAARFMAENPAHRRQMIEEPGILPDAIEELFRRFGVPNTARTVKADYVYQSQVPFKMGDQVMLPKLMHGLDERRFPDPLKVDFRRPKTAHAAFGAGPHRCPGSYLARTELKVFLQEWLGRIPEFRVKPGGRIVCQSGVSHSTLELPLVWSV